MSFTPRVVVNEHKPVNAETRELINSMKLTKVNKHTSGASRPRPRPRVMELRAPARDGADGAPQATGRT